MEKKGDEFISNFRRLEPKDETYRIRTIQLTYQPIRVLCACVHLSKSISTILYLFQMEPLLFEFFPLYDKMNQRFPRFFEDMNIWYGVMVYRTSARDVSNETFLFQVCIATRQIEPTRYLMRHHGFSVVGTDDQYYEWTQKLEGNTRCYRAVLTILGIARSRKKAQRDTLGLVAKALWSTRASQEWEPLLT